MSNQNLCFSPLIDVEVDDHAKHRLYVIRKAYAAELDRIIGAGISGVNNKEVWIEEFDDEYEFCPHIMALILLADEYTKQYDPGDYTDLTALRFMRSFDRERVKTIAAEMSEDEGNVVLEPRIVEGLAGHELNFRIGNGGKLFVVKNLTDLHDIVNERKQFSLGKSGMIDFASETFSEESQKLYSLIEREVKRAKAIERRMERKRTYQYSGTLETGKAVPLTGDAIDTIYDMMFGRQIDYKPIEEKGKQKLMIDTSDPVIDLFLEVKTEKNNPGKLREVRVSGWAPTLIDGVKSQYFISNGHLSKLSEEAWAHIRPFAEASSDYDGSFEFKIGRKQATSFYYKVLPLLREDPVFRIEEAGSIDGLIPAEAEFSFYLDAAEGQISCEAFAVYGEEKYRLKPVYLGTDHIVSDPNRDLNQEMAVNDVLEEMFAQYDEEQGAFIAEDEADVRYEMLKSGVNRLLSLGEVSSTDAFTNIRIRKSGVLQLGVSLENDLLDLDIQTQDMELSELAELIDSYKKKKKYHRLRNGDFIELEENESLDALMTIVEDMNVPVKEFVSGKFHLPAYRALYLETMLEDHEDMVAGRDKTFRTLVKDFKTISDSDYEVPENLRKILRPYQSYGFKWLETLEAAGFGGILADDMGLGKTLQVITMVLADKERAAAAEASGNAAGTAPGGTALVVCPASLVYNWVEEIARFAPEMKSAAVAGNKAARREILRRYEHYDFIITSYDLLKRDIDMYEPLRFRWQIIDEAQFIKNANSAAAKSVKLVHAPHKFALTGTPIENRLSELWSIFDYLMPGFLYSYDRFRKEYEVPISKGKDQGRTDALKNLISPFILRRKKQDVLKDLPEKLEEIQYAGFEEEQRKLYDSQVTRISKLIDSEETDFDRSRIQILAELTKIRQICCDPRLLFDNYSGNSAKLEVCLDLIRSAMDGGHKILLFSQFTSMLSIIEEKLINRGIDYYKITGSTPKEERLRRVKAFNSDDVPLFLISLKAGGTGLNLTGADIVIHYDPWWNQAAQDQATDRAHRIGQTKNVTVYRLIAKDSIEEKIVKLQESKKELADSVLSGETKSLGTMSREELRQLLGV